MNAKNIVTLLISIVISANLFAQSAHKELLAVFADIPTEMNVPQLNAKINASEALNDKHLAALDEVAISNSAYYPLGKIVNGKSATLLYMEVHFSDDDKTINIFYLNSKTIHTKTGDITSTTSNLLAGGVVNETTYNGHYKLTEKDGIIFHQNEVNANTNKETVRVQEYRFGKKFEFVKNH